MIGATLNNPLIPKVVVGKIIDTYKDYTEQNIPTMLYKLGLPSQTIESQQ